ncbi:MAG: hypothetical protein ACREJD_10335 [Phycisphaerales bacterium]
MKFIGHLAAATLAMCAGGSAFAVWGVKYEVNSGSGWTTATTIDVSGGPKSVDFRISVYHDGAMAVSGGGIAWAPFRFCNSQRINNFGNAVFGDTLVTFKCSLGTVNSMALAHNEVGSDMILGTPNVIQGFASNINYAFVVPRPQQLSTEYYNGKLLVGNSGSGSSSRTITLTANSFSFPGAANGSGGAYGASFFVSNTTSAFGVALEAATTVPAVITVKLLCLADLNDDGIVGDADFALFCASHDLLDCSDPSMPAGCPADLNGDGVVDDVDFVAFVSAYDQLICP